MYRQSSAPPAGRILITIKIRYFQVWKFCRKCGNIKAVMFFWVLKKETAIEAVSEGIEKPLGKWFYPLGKYVYCTLTLVALIAGAILGGIG